METHLFTPEYNGTAEPMAGDSKVSRSPGLKNPDFSHGDLEGWVSDGGAFSRVKDEKGAYLVTSYDGDSDGGKAMGRLWQEFKVDRTMTYLQFDLYGGHGSVKLIEGQDLLRRTSGPMGRDKPLRARWNLQPLAGRTVRLVIEDRHQDAWGYVKVSGFQIKRK
jgi:hypothetical protein